jgi:hypothetical protein
MRHALLAIAAALAATAAPTAALAQAKAHAMHAAAQRQASVTLPDALTWGPAPAVLPQGAKVAALEGDPAKPARSRCGCSFPTAIRSRRTTTRPPST